MRHWSQLATRNLRTKRVRTLGALAAIALGVGSVVWVTCCYESVRRAVSEWAQQYVGASHLNIESVVGKYSPIPDKVVGLVENLDGVQAAIPLLVLRLRGVPCAAADLHSDEPRDKWQSPEVDLHGVDLVREPLVRKHALRAGRMLRDDDDLACVLEASFAEEHKLGLGDYLLVWGESDTETYALQIVGLIERRRIARFQKAWALVRLPVLQRLANRPAAITSVDVILKDAQPATSELFKIQNQVRFAVRKAGIAANVRTAAARMQQVERAQEQQNVILVLLSSVAMLTALFIILSTLSMGMIERITQLGLMRCVGMTRAQLAALVFVEVVPLGVIGIGAGIPIGLAFAAASVWLVPDYVGQFTVSVRGIGLAVAAGLVTTLVAAFLPAVAALTVTPLEAARPRARVVRRWPLVLTFVLALAALAGQLWIATEKVQRDPDFVRWATTAVVLLYLTFALAAPFVVLAVGAPAVHGIARLVGIRVRLLQDQVGHAVWRSAGICCGLMVGLSLIVGLLVFNESFKTGWQFPKQFPAAYLWSFEQLPPETAERARGIPGVKECTVANAVNVIVEERKLIMEQVFRSVTWFLGIEPDAFLDIVRFEFVEGDEQTARRLLKQGGHVLITADFARTRNKGVVEKRNEKGDVIVSNSVRIYFSDRWHTYRVAGVIDSPALDIAAGYFQAESEMRVVANGSVIGANEDLKKDFGQDGARLVLLNFDLPAESPPPAWPPARGSREAAGLLPSVWDEKIALDERWARQREQQVLEELRRRVHAPQSFVGTARELKQSIDNELTRMTTLLTAVPTVALLVAALGVANLMTANVTSRTKQLAILRAVGATRGLILRMVIGEALVLGVLGTALGLSLGLRLAYDITMMTTRMWGYAVPFNVPWAFVGAAVLLTVGLCVLAGILPARHASRTNVIDALHVP